MIRGWSADEKVADAVVAPDRYADPEYSGADFLSATSWTKVREAFTYKEGEVIYVERFVAGRKVCSKARVVDLLPDHDRDGWRRELYYVQFETKAGLWSKIGERVFPGFIERGYQIAAKEGALA